jgi:hypothetical protein
MLKWVVTLTVLIALAAVGLLVEKPRGSIVGSVILEASAKEGYDAVFNTDNVKEANARVIAYGNVVRASYVDKDGKFRIDGLPVGNYSLRVRADGYNSQSQWNIKVSENKIKKIEQFKLYFLSPSLDLASNTKVYTTQEHPYLWFTSSAIKDVQFKLYRFDPVKMLKKKEINTDNYFNFLIGNYYYGSYDFVSEITKDNEPVKTWEQKVIYGSDDYARNNVSFDSRLSEGSYLLVAEAKSTVDGRETSDAYWFGVTKIGLIAKQDPEKMLFRTVNLETLEPEAGVKLKIYDRSNKYALMATVQTNKDGIAEYLFDKDYSNRYSSLFVLAEKGESLAVNGSYAWYYTSDKYRVYVYTDRPIYRPDQTVYFKGIVRTVEKEGIKNLQDESLKVTIFNPDDDPLKVYNLKTNKFGTYNGLLTLPKNAMLGAYRIKTELHDQEYYSYFEISEYRKPEYKVDVKTASDLVIGGSRATATIMANYFFGYPVTGAKVKYTVYAKPDYSLKWKLIPRPEYYSYYDDWDDDDMYYYTGYRYGDSSGEIIAQGYATTDENGEAKVTFDTKPVSISEDSFYSYYDAMAQKYWVEAEVTDISRKTSTGKGGFNVVAGEYAMFLDTDYYVYTQDQDIRVNVRTIDYDKNPVSRRVDLQLQKWDWNKDEWEYTNPKVISNSHVTTDKKGEATSILEIPANAPTRTYRIIAYSKDSQGNQITSASYVWVSNYAYRASKAEVKPKIQVTLDKKVYQPGDIAKVMIVSPVKPVKGLQALLTIEGNTLYEHKLIDITDPAMMIRLPVKANYMPNAYISVSLVGPEKQFYQDTKMIKISPDTNFLTLDIKPDKERYMPQEEVKYTIKATDSRGNPVQAELSVGVVDESIYAIREDYTPDIKKFFYQKNPNLVQTSYSFAQNYSAGGDKIQPRIRKDFKDTAFWNATVTTDENGIAIVKFKLPDNLTTWRTTVRAVTQETKVASAINNILVTKDIIVRLALPRFYTVGDKAVLSTIVHNYTENKQDLQLKLNLPSNFKSLKKNDTFVQVASMDKARQDWMVEAVTAGEAKVQAFALSSAIEGDAVEHDINVLPYGILKSNVLSAKNTDDTAVIPIENKITEKIVPGSLNWQVRLTASPAGMILGSLDYLIGYPYGCVEQTMSKLLPSLIAGDISKTLGVPLKPKSEKKLKDVVADGLDRLYKMQNTNGGWGWWTEGEADVYMTTYVLHGLKYAIDSGYKIDRKRVDNAVSWLEGYLARNEVQKEMNNFFAGSADRINLNSREVTNLCYASYVLSLYGKKNEVVLKKLYQESSKIQSSGLSYLSMAFGELGYQEYAVKLVDELLTRVDVNAPAISFAVLKHLGISFNYNTAEVTAIALRAIIKVKPDSFIVDKMVNYLIDNRQGNYWENTKTTSVIVLALSEYIKESMKHENPDYELIIKVNGNHVQRLKFNKENMFDPERVIEIPDRFITDTNQLVIEKTGNGPLYYTSDFSYYQIYSPEDIIPARDDNGVKITKELFRLKSKTDKDGNITYSEVPLRGSIYAGELLLVKLTIDTSKFGEYLILEDPKASSMEVVSTDPDNKLNMKRDDDYFWWRTWWTHQEDKDTHMAFFMNRLKSGSYEVKYLVRPEFPGEYMIRPTVLEGMYSSRLGGSSVSSRLTVKE